MGYSVFPAPAAGSKTRYAVTLLSGTSWTVPTGCTYINATLIGGGAGGTGAENNTTTSLSYDGYGGQIVESSFSTTPGASISYSIGAGGSGGPNNSEHTSGAGGTTTMTGATSAVGGAGVKKTYGSSQNAGTPGLVASNGGRPMEWFSSGGAGGAGAIFIEYWV